MAYLKHLRDYVLVDLDSGTVLGDPRRVVLVHDENMPEDGSDWENIAAAEAYGVYLPDFYYDEE